MITFSRLGKKGNLGNQLFQIASTIGISENYKQEFCFPYWEYSNYFEINFNKCPNVKDWILVSEEKFNYYEREILNYNYDLDGWLQSEKYFSHSNIKNVFEFKLEFENNLLEKHKILFSRKSILVSVRRGDFVNNVNYFQLTYKFYLTALLHHFDNLEEYNIVFTSDSISYCKKHFSFLPNVFFLEDLKPIEQLCLASKFDNYIISNSTFSWWLAWLGEETKTKIIRPVQIFDGEFAIKYDESDYFPARWIPHNESDFKLSNQYFMLKIYGYLYGAKERMIYLVKKKKKVIKNQIKKIIGYK
ncbi:alpha-1,2-fucosyltransferase [Flavobacterium sp. LB2R40]|uniref:alpha-1,2-fucosyltransferase n=1 Tax=Flavobacterium sp. LB2R40 TaxID=3401722 RepID=UPI003AABE014